ncbi:MAG: tRNA (adenosine(37)-N6)-dimethylallyltransferase MiaA [Planctomycetota bacterium]|jgi:tRNA dimethylallyltransferase
MSSPIVPCLIGPTGVGKTGVALSLARQGSGEVIACDAFTVYRGMEILTAAPPLPGDVPHHLVACLDASASWSAARFADACDRLIEEIRGRGRVPWIVGGTALYLRSWLKGFGAPVPRDAPYRQTLEAIVEREGPDALHARLAALDPERAAELHPNDVRRVVRALEIIRATGRPASAQREEWTGPDRPDARVWALRRAQEDLDARIARRTEQMFEAGVVEEARRLLAGAVSPEAAKVLGLSVLEALLGGEIGEAEAKEEIARRTRRFARKQMTFFRSFERARWIDMAPDEEAGAVAARILEALAEETT